MSQQDTTIATSFQNEHSDGSNPADSISISDLAECSFLPPPAEGESASAGEWFEAYAADFPLDEFRRIAIHTRGGRHKCTFGERRVGGFNLALTLTFDDGVEWIFKAPKVYDKTAMKRVDSEVATLKFLEKIGTVPAPRVHDFSATYKNPAKTPYILMDKIAGRTLSEALHEGMPGEAIRRTLEGLASFRKSLRQNPFEEVGSLVFGCDLDDDSDEDPDDQWIGKLASQGNHYFIGELLNIWAAHLEPYQYQSQCSASALEYYFGQHTLSLASEAMYGDLHEIAEKWLAHHYIASLLPAYVQPSEHIFYLAHTDLNASNIMVNPLDGTVTGIIDWEFANTLPPQAVEHYPAFLASRERFMDVFHDCLADPSSELDEWRSLYAQHFDDTETVTLHSRIDTIIQFEYLLRHINYCPLEKISEVVNALKAANALYSPLPKFPWESFVNAENTTT